jgi:hypothetical protein
MVRFVKLYQKEHYRQRRHILFIIENKKHEQSGVTKINEQNYGAVRSAQKA